MNEACIFPSTTSLGKQEAAFPPWTRANVCLSAISAMCREGMLCLASPPFCLARRRKAWAPADTSVLWLPGGCLWAALTLTFPAWAQLAFTPPGVKANSGSAQKPQRATAADCGASKGSLPKPGLTMSSRETVVWGRGGGRAAEPRSQSVPPSLPLLWKAGRVGKGGGE